LIHNRESGKSLSFSQTFKDEGLGKFEPPFFFHISLKKFLFAPSQLDKSDFSRRMHLMFLTFSLKAIYTSDNWGETQGTG
jgi:hypothetical protein